MMNMMPGTGMGAAGTGMGAGPMMPGQGGVNPQLLAMLAQMQGGGAGGMPAAPGPMNAPTTGTPMAGYIGSGMRPGMGGTMAPPVGAAPGLSPGAAAAGVTGSPQGLGQMNPQLMQLLQQLKGAQGGVPGGQMPPGTSAWQQPQAASDSAMSNPTAGPPSGTGFVPQGAPPGAGMPAGAGASPGWLQALLAHLQGGAPAPAQ